MIEKFTIGIISAFLASFSFATSSVATRRGVLYGDVYSNAFLSILIGIPMYGLYILYNGDYIDFGNIPFFALILFVLAGILHFVIGRYLLYTSIHYIGASSSFPIISTSNILSAFIAIPLLSEKLSLLKFFGLLIASIGIFLIATIGFEIKGFRIGFIMALFAAVTFSITSVIIRVALLIFSSPLLGVLISYLSSLIIYISLITFDRVRSELSNIFSSEVLKFMIISGILVNFGQLFRYLSLDIIEVSVVGPIFSLIPIMTILLSYLINKEVEIINWKNSIASIIIVSGVILVIMGQ